MQTENAQNRTFLHRTDFIASVLNVDIQDLPQILGVSRRTIFAGRSGDSKVSRKTWLKLEKVESEIKEKGDFVPRGTKLKGSENRDENWKNAVEPPKNKEDFVPRGTKLKGSEQTEMDEIRDRLTRVESLLEELVEHLTARRDGGSSGARGEEKAG